jgi:hypothetical protein
LTDNIDIMQNAIETAETYLRTTLSSVVGYPAQEALIYMVSRGHDCDDVIQEVREKWRLDSKSRPFGDTCRFWSEYSPYSIFYDSTMLRTAEWCKIGGYDDHWNYLYKSSENYHKDYTELDYYPFFPYFRSKSAILNMKKQLVLTLDGYEKYFLKSYGGWKNSTFEDVDQYENGTEYYVYTLMGAAYIFGSCQIPSQILDFDFRNQVIDYLLKTQLAN